MEARQLLYTVDEFEKIADAPENRERLLELIDGEIVEKVPTELHGTVAAMFAHWLLNFIITHNIKGRVATEALHRMPKDKRNARLPDVSYRAGSQPIVTKGSVPQMPDLAVEVKSPDDTWKDLRTKARYYLANGTKLVWLVEPVRRFVEVYSPDDVQQFCSILYGFLPFRAVK